MDSVNREKHRSPAPLAARSTDEVLEELCLAVRAVAESTQFLAYRPPDLDVQDEVLRVQEVARELARRKVDPSERLERLTGETGWLMPELYRECLGWPLPRPWVRDAADGIRIAMRCPACETAEMPPDARTVRLCDRCLDVLDVAIETVSVRDHLLLYRTYNPEARCCDAAGDDTVLGVFPWSPEWSEDFPSGICRACIATERARRATG